jgi:hypothetical protein
MKTIKSGRSNEAYWEQHIRAYYASGLKKRDYCQRNKIKFSQMRYWQGRLKGKRQEASSFIPIGIKSESIPLNDKAICTLALSGDLILRVYDEKALLLILDKYR